MPTMGDWAMSYNVMIFAADDGIVNVDFVSFDESKNPGDIGHMTIHHTKPIADIRNLSIACVNWCRYGHAPGNVNLNLLDEEGKRK